jgi:hypothetical protein
MTAVGRPLIGLTRRDAARVLAQVGGHRADVDDVPAAALALRPLQRLLRAGEVVEEVGVERVADVRDSLIEGASAPATAALLMRMSQPPIRSSASRKTRSTSSCFDWSATVP